jgi:HAMP domain-containing protein
MSVIRAIRQSLSAKVAIRLTFTLLLLAGLAAALLTAHQTELLQEASLDKARLTAILAARQYGDLFDNAIDSELLTIHDVLDTSYVEIKGWDWKGKPKFHTRYDTFTDRAMLVFQDKILEQEEYVYAVGLDVNGYIPTHNTIGQRPLDGTDLDLLMNRTKRIFNSNPTELNRARNTEPFLLQVYHRDTGETMWDASAPIWVKGKHWGAFVLGVSMRKIEARKHSLLLYLAAMFATFIVVTVGAIFLMVRRAMLPVVALTEAANRISLGDGLEIPIRSEAIDEVGVLTKAIDRLRASMSAALSRLNGE